MEYNFNELLDEMVPRDIDPPKRKEREPPAFIIRPQRFSMGSVQGPVFRQEFSVEVDHAVVNLNFAEQSFFFRIPFDDAPFNWPILQAVSSIDDLQAVRLVKQNERVATLTVTLRRPPKIEADFRRVEDAVEGLEIRRATEIDWSPHEVEEGRSGPPATMPHGYWAASPMKFGLWLTYRFEFTFRASELKRITVALSRLRALDRPGTEKITVDPEAAPDHVDRSTRLNPYVDSNICNIDEQLKEYPFDGLLLPIEVGNLKHSLVLVPLNSRVTVLRALFRLERGALVGRDRIHKQIRNLTGHMTGDMPTPIAPVAALPKDRVSMRRAVVTPTRVLLFPEVIETSNRVLRAWPAEMRAGRFIRVGFADEDGRLRITKRIVKAEYLDPDGGILARIRNVLHNGVWIAGRHYKFLAAGESQLKDHSCWMVCEMDGFTADRIREQMGDFSKEHVVAKYAARMGLCFSATRHVVDLVKADIEPLDDITHNEGKYTYTDGVGNCSQELASMCAKALGSDEKAPSAVQIRMGGIKGVLSVHPHLEKNQVCIRPSMRKFDSPLMGLGVMKVSRFAPAHLNRQAICVMSALGMNAHALLSKFTQQIHHAQNLELELQSLDTSRHPAKHIYKNAFIPITEMIKAGLAEQQLLKNVLKCIKCQLLRDLKYKARVLVPDGAYLMGIADEYEYAPLIFAGIDYSNYVSVLEEGQIYCAITPSGAKSRRVLTGQCTIFRSPCIHPGDARLVTAVDHRLFQEMPLTNVVVFSTKKSERDLPSMLGGGDLDGDFYTVIYDKELQITRVHEPMDYTPVTPVKKDKVEMFDIENFVADFIKSDVLGLVASDLMALADLHGPAHPSCLKLAQINSDAVDFPKSGVPVHVPDELRPRRYPDFMDRHPDFSYPSTRVLGMMYRLIEPAPEYQPSDEICIDTRITSRRVLPIYLKAAGIMKQNYDVELEGIMRQGVPSPLHSLCEAEIITGVSIMSEQKRRRAADDAIRGPVREATDSLFSRYRRDARRFVKANPSANALENWAIACYQVTHVPEHRSRWVDALNHSRRGSTAMSDDGTEDGEYLEVTRRELISFPWLWSHEICRSLQDAVIKEEEEEDEDFDWRRPWDDDDSDTEEEEIKAET
ncbi:RNA-dependent RNA polymerase [Mycena sanguinolenta]|uniref:RNA-dependent RNA polymerase n=1 Tax=Mycena sanguinolenta TaxID=230812 RepID=A0A8H6Y1U2_9AGAR|nr:RNA-dependent RNA polymerase [Mycena sanguinolenta]